MEAQAGPFSGRSRWARVWAACSGQRQEGPGQRPLNLDLRAGAQAGCHLTFPGSSLSEEAHKVQEEDPILPESLQGCPSALMEIIA